MKKMFRFSQDQKDRMIKVVNEYLTIFQQLSEEEKKEVLNKLFPCVQKTDDPIEAILEKES